MLDFKRDLEAERKRRQELLEGVAGLRTILGEAMEGSRARLQAQIEEEKAAREGRVESVRRGIAAMLEGVGLTQDATCTGTLLIEEDHRREESPPFEDDERARMLRQRAIELIANRGLPKVMTTPRTIPPEAVIKTPLREATPIPPKRKKNQSLNQQVKPRSNSVKSQRSAVTVVPANSEKEKERAKTALKALRGEAESKLSEREKRKKELLKKTQQRIDRFCKDKGIGETREERSEAALKHATVRYKQLSEEREKEELAKALREQYLARCREDQRRQYLQEITENVKSRKRPSPKKARIPRSTTPDSQSAVFRDPTPVWNHPAPQPLIADDSYEDVRRVTVNLFDSIISEPSGPTSPSRAVSSV
eukprot:TRINITY_DN12127_c0_g1_i1.p1 TRINITY_DN12127_c0_g1~~TRINITY_DN12127_c0_g1_i1.p1  ORF type:complete len:380 (+),score=76.03 TRINITY_DN12127_c0_g1_i1:46-1140(+)